MWLLYRQNGYKTEYYTTNGVHSNGWVECFGTIIDGPMGLQNKDFVYEKAGSILTKNERTTSFLK